MSGRKSDLLKFQIVTNGSMGGDITSAVTNIQYQDNIGIQLVFTGTPTGTFFVDLSINYYQDQNGNVINAGTWTPMSFSTAPAAAGSASDIYLDLNPLSSPWIRTRYVRGSGTGTLNAYLCGKQV